MPEGEGIDVTPNAWRWQSGGTLTSRLLRVVSDRGRTKPSMSGGATFLRLTFERRGTRKCPALPAGQLHARLPAAEEKVPQRRSPLLIGDLDLPHRPLPSRVSTALTR